MKIEIKLMHINNYYYLDLNFNSKLETDMSSVIVKLISYFHLNRHLINI